MNWKYIMTVAGLTAGFAAFAQAKENFIQQQAYAEMQKVSGQVDVLQTNLNELQKRVGALEGGGDTRGIRQEIESLKVSVAELRKMIQNQRAEIVRDLSDRLSKIQPVPAPKPTAKVEKKVVVGPHIEYVVQSGDTLSLIAQAFDTTVPKIKELNNLKNDNLRVGQKLNLPKK
ncbi:MAG: LysM peptidoglycan-binding domain-containing protein [Kiritimatiellae bacterium]|nr:LysM peptidoglycan-binding domain-containing protein [Kiritimatiellia bacterium]